MIFNEIRRRLVGTPLDCSDLHPVLRRVYAARGVACREDLDLTLDRLLPVGSLPGVEAAAGLLTEHRAGRVLVIGDFDADGATSSALVVRALRALKFSHVDFLVPDRFRFGYGLTPEIVALGATREPSLIVTVDNGVSSIEGVEAARTLGIPVLVTDHHLPGSTLPSAGDRESQPRGFDVRQYRLGRRRRRLLFGGGTFASHERCRFSRR
jgi:single-stranded-DNA-specific exonuclease